MQNKIKMIDFYKANSFKIAVLLLMSILFLNTKAQQLLTLNEALKIALENNYSIQVAKNEAEITKNNNYAGAAGMLPTIAATANQDNVVNNTQQKFLNGTENNRDDAKSNQFNAGVDLGWTIFDGLKMFATKNKLNQLQQIGELKMRLQIEQSFYRIIMAYLSIVQNKKLLKAYEQGLIISEQRLELVNNKYNVGKVSKNEVLKAQVDLNTDKALLLKQQNVLLNSKNILNQYLARNIETNFEIDEKIEINKNLTFDEIQKKAIAQNTNLMIVKKNNEITSFYINEIKAERLPTLQLKTGYNFNRQNSEAGFLQASQTNGFHYGAALNLNLLNGFSLNKRLKSAQLNSRITDLILKDSISKLELNVHQIFNTYMLALKLYQIETENILVAESSFKLSNEQYQIGVISAMELREAQQNLLLNSIRLNNALIETKMAEMELLRVSAEIFKMVTN